MSNRGILAIKMMPLIMLAIGLHPQLATGRKCYVCDEREYGSDGYRNNDYDPECGIEDYNNPNYIHKVEMEEKYDPHYYCASLVYPSGSVRRLVVVRHPGTPNRCESSRDGHYCVCNTDLCNTGYQLLQAQWEEKVLIGELDL